MFKKRFLEVWSKLGGKILWFLSGLFRVNCEFIGCGVCKSFRMSSLGLEDETYLSKDPNRGKLSVLKKYECDNCGHKCAYKETRVRDE